MYKDKRWLIPLVTLKNDDQLEANVLTLRKAAKLTGTRIRLYGRCHDRRTAFSTIPRGYAEGQGGNSNSIYSIKSPLAKFCYEWKVYRYETRAEADARYNKYLEKMRLDRFLARQ